MVVESFTEVSFFLRYKLGISDLKPENILLSDKGPDATIKIADFGLAVEMSEPKAKMGLTGTPMYIAPEILKSEAYGTAADMWSIGCVLYIMLVGYPAFW